VVLSHSTPHEKQPDGALVIGCSQFRSEAAGADGQTGIRVRCEHVEFFTNRGLSGRAAQLAYDSASRRLELRSGEDQPVQLAWNAPSADAMNLVATAVQIDLKFRPQGAAVDAPAAVCHCPACGSAGCECTPRQAAKCCPAQPAVRPLFAAQADAIRYDPSQGLYILESGDHPRTTIWHQEPPGSPAAGNPYHDPDPAGVLRFDVFRSLR
jgi:hypothetical protein